MIDDTIGIQIIEVDEVDLGAKLVTHSAFLGRDGKPPDPAVLAATAQAWHGGLWLR